MPTNSDELRGRTRRFAFNIIDLIKRLPHNIAPTRSRDN